MRVTYVAERLTDLLKFLVDVVVQVRDCEFDWRALSGVDWPIWTLQWAIKIVLVLRRLVVVDLREVSPCSTTPVAIPH